MSKTSTARKYGKSIKKSRAEELFAELPRSPVVKRNGPPHKPKQQQNASETDSIGEIAKKLLAITLKDGTPTPAPAPEPAQEVVVATPSRDVTPRPIEIQVTPLQPPETLKPTEELPDEPPTELPEDDLRVLTWDDVCQFGDRVEK